MDKRILKKGAKGFAVIAAISALCLALVGCAGGATTQTASSANDEKADTFVIMSYAYSGSNGAQVQTEYTRDDAGNPVSAKTTTDGNTTSELAYEVDTDGIITKLTTTSYTADGQERGTQTTEPKATLDSDGLPTEMVYDYEAMEFADGTTSVGSSAVTTYQYAGGREVGQKSVSTATSNDQTSVSSVEYLYGENGLLESLIQESHLEDASGQVIERTYTGPDGVETSSTREATYTYQYNSEDSCNISDGENNVILTLEFDDDGNVTSVKNEAGDVIASYTWKKIDEPSKVIAATSGLIGDYWYYQLMA